jgi:hypothetical protein
VRFSFNKTAFSFMIADRGFAGPHFIALHTIGSCSKAGSFHSKGLHYKTFTIVLDLVAKWGRFAIMVRPIMGLHSEGRLLALPTNIKLG